MASNNLMFYVIFLNRFLIDMRLKMIYWQVETRSTTKYTDLLSTQILCCDYYWFYLFMYVYPDWGLCMATLTEVYVWLPWLRFMYGYPDWGLCMATLTEVYVWLPWLRFVYGCPDWGLCMAALTEVYVWLPWLRFMYGYPDWGLCMATLTEVFPRFFLSCKANARVKPAKTGHGLHSSIFALFYVLFVLCRSLYCVCVYMCTVLLLPGGYPIAVKYIIYHII